MFFFGDSEATARLYIDNALAVTGPKVPDIHYDEMTEQELKNTFAYLYGALRTAYLDNAYPEVIAVITKDYDAVFQRVAEVSEDFRDVVARGRHMYLPDRSLDTVMKYKELAGLI